MWKESFENIKISKTPIAAFAYIEGKLYFGANHVDLMSALGRWDERGWKSHEPTAFGWLIENNDGSHTAEFFSDFYQHAQDSSIFEHIFQLLKEKDPKITALTYAPDQADIEKAEDLWEDKLGKTTFYFRWTKTGGVEILDSPPFL